MQKFLGFMISLLGGGGEQLWDSGTRKIRDLVEGLVWPLITLVFTAGLIYVIILGVQYAKAETSDKKDEAKKRIINACVGVVIMVLLLALLYWLLGDGLGLIQSLVQPNN